MLTSLVKALRILNSEADPSQISLALSFAMAAGFLPFFNPINLILLFFVLILRVNLSTFLLALAFFSGVEYVFDPLFNSIGLTVLTVVSLKSLWTALYNTTFFRLLDFNNSIVMGSLILSAFLFVPLFMVSNYIIRKYREHILKWVEKSRVMQFFKATDFYRMYQRYSKVRSGL